MTSNKFRVAGLKKVGARCIASTVGVRFIEPVNRRLAWSVNYKKRAQFIVPLQMTLDILSFCFSLSFSLLYTSFLTRCSKLYTVLFWLLNSGSWLPSSSSLYTIYLILDTSYSVRSTLSLFFLP